ncbi:hypothetical protein E1B28_000173 [Marasmius oreades]|uniref:Uncharacterized protein n=1 Tax=Marasmius oreades TaxID=181124 RepID=A0A9P7UPA8_9AGAR|nr:uncharacterized protein E1B28_002790 [Marasmius oreades]XP_043014675.1 uncharacterized protein E1B28_000173 [Marasmius oreades]KAG7086869.1 hypothetical protein E1B28_002790 [Marasmius oreades]KAG7098205.1 hypothetical protein E1B28_000173 [Marasmius oreades]
MNSFHSQLYHQGQDILSSPFSDMGNESLHSQQFNMNFLKTMQNQAFLIQSITEQQLRASGNTVFLQLEKENHELRERIDTLQTQLLKYALSSSSPLLPGSSSSFAASQPSARLKIPLKQSDYPLVKHWDRTPNNTSQLAIIKVTDSSNLSDISDDGSSSESEAHSDSDNNKQGVPQKRRKKHGGKKNGKSKRDGVPAYLENENGKVVDLNTKIMVYDDARAIWNQRIDLAKPPANWSSAGAELRDEFRDVLEEKHPFLQLCSRRWKVEEIWKRNYHSWLKARLKRLDKPSPPKKTKSSVTDKYQSTAGPASDSGLPEATMPATAATLCAGSADLPAATMPATLSDVSDVSATERAPPATQVIIPPKVTNPTSNARKGKARVLPQVKNSQLNSSNQCDPLLAAIHIDVQSLEDKITGHSQPDENTASTSTPASPVVNQPSASVPGPAPNERTPSMGPGPTSSTPTAQASTVPLGTKTGLLGGYSVDPATLTADCPEDGLVWESGWDSQLTRLIPADISQVCPLVLRGKYGLMGLVKLMEHLVRDRKVAESLLEQKVKRLLAAIDQVTERQVTSSSTAVITTKAAPRKRNRGSWAIPKHVCPKWEYAVDWKIQNPHGTMKEFEKEWKTMSQDKERVMVYQARVDDKLGKNRQAT